MKLAHLIAAAVAVTGLSLPLLSASAGPVPQDTAALKGHTESGATLAGGGMVAEEAAAAAEWRRWLLAAAECTMAEEASPAAE